MDAVKVIQDNLGSAFFNFAASSTYVKVGVIVALLFLLILSLAQVRRHFMRWGAKGGLVGIFFGFLLALILEGFLIIGGKTAVTELLGWQNTPKLMQVALDGGRSRLIKVLGVSDQIPQSAAKSDPTLNDAIGIFQNLNPTDSKTLKSLICQP